MVVETGEHEIAQVGRPVGFPRDNVMDIGEGHVRAAWEATMSIPAQDLSALGLARKPPGPALVHGVPDVVVDREDDGGVTGDPLHCLSVDEADVLELTGERRALP